MSGYLGTISYEPDSGWLYEGDVYLEEVKPGKFEFRVEVECSNDRTYQIILEKAVWEYADYIDRAIEQGNSVFADNGEELV